MLASLKCRSSSARADTYVLAPMHEGKEEGEEKEEETLISFQVPGFKKNHGSSSRSHLESLFSTQVNMLGLFCVFTAGSIYLSKRAHNYILNKCLEYSNMRGP